MRKPTAMTLLLLIVSAPAGAQEKLPKEVNDAVKAYEAKMDALQKEIEAKRLQARTELDQILLEQQKAAMAEGNAKAAELIEQERSDIKAMNDRLDLHNALVGHTYRRDGKSTRWVFRSDGTVRAPRGTKYPWVTLNGHEVLLLKKDGSMRILQFNKDRSRCRIGFLPPTKTGKNSLSFVK